MDKPILVKDTSICPTCKTKLHKSNKCGECFGSFGHCKWCGWHWYPEDTGYYGKEE